MPECHACGKSEHLEWERSKNDRWYLVEVRRIPHSRVCPQRAPKDELVAWLQAQGATGERAARIAAKVPAGPLEERMAKAFQLWETED